jgi:thiamine pyrophosphokinase
VTALVLAGSDIRVTAELRARCAGAALCVAADSGVRHAAPLGVAVDLIVGDFDSATAADLAPYGKVPRRRHPARKDLLDLELALLEAAARGARDLLIVGALGGRLDQTLAALFIAARLHARHDVALHSGFSAAYPLRAGEVRRLELPPGQPFSLLSLTPVSTVSLSGASYPLAREPLPFGVGRGVSNEVAASPLRVTLHDGSALLLLEFG